MRATKFYIATLKEAPADAEIASHKLMLRAGMIRRLAAGIYTYMPLGLRVIRRIEAIVREQMAQAGAVELLMPVIQPAELWMESGRWEKMGPELLRIKDRHERDFIVQPTSEEVISEIARDQLRSYKQLPVNFFHIQTKFRDERRPRFGVMRGREFTMKDAYSFDRDEVGMMASYQIMFEAYGQIFKRMGLSVRAVQADTGNIGGQASHEFQLIADTGEDAIAFCANSGYAANVELAEALPLLKQRNAPAAPLTQVATPGVTRCSELAALLNVPLQSTVKALVLAVESSTSENIGAPVEGSVDIWLLMVRGDHELNEVKASKLAGLKHGWRFASESEIIEHFGCSPGSLGPVGISDAVRVVADRTVALMSDFICGANEAGFHLTGVNWARDLPEPMVADLRTVQPGDPSPDGQGALEIQRGIEVGHVFAGLPYPEKMKLAFTDETGQVKSMFMGCYGIGITRLLGAAIEQHHDDKGIRWPTPIAPFSIVICPVNYRQSDQVRMAADGLHAELVTMGVDVLLDDRGERPGAMFADMELIGIPHRLTIGERGIKAGVYEFSSRTESEAVNVPIGEVKTFIAARLAQAMT